jgi:hypothetical protein
MTSVRVMPLILGGILLVASGLLCILCPSLIGRYDTRMRRVFDKEVDYLFAVRVFGTILALFALLVVTLLLVTNLML